VQETKKKGACNILSSISMVHLHFKFQNLAKFLVLFSSI